MASGRGDDWWDNDWDYRVLLTVAADGTARTDKPAEVEINFTNLLDDLNQGGSLIVNSIRVIEVNNNGVVIDDNVPFQFDPAANFHAGNNARGTLVFLLQGQTGATATRRYHVYFDTAGTFSVPSFPAQVTLTDSVQDKGYASYRIVTGDATYFYHKTGGGFSSLDDANGNDWIDWNSSAGGAGDFRGIPNMVHPADGGYFHPGRNLVSSTVLYTGPLKATFKSTSNGGGDWEVMWEIFPDYARMTVLKKASGKNYWFLYEGTPGGVLEGNKDFVVRSSGQQNNAGASWTGDLNGEEWVFIADPSVGRSIYLAHHTEDNVVDSYKPDNNVLMTILGFGRDNNSRNLSAVPKQFTVGLVDSTTLNGVQPVVRNAYKPLGVSLGAAEGKDGGSGPTPTPGPTPTATPPPQAHEGVIHLSTPGNVTLNGATYRDEDVLSYDLATGQWSLLFDGSAAGLPGKADIDGLAKVGDDLYLSFLVPVSMPGIGLVDDADIVLYSGGVFSLWLDGSAYGLMTTGENIDAISFDQQGRLVISTAAGFTVPGASGNVKGQDEDLLLLDGTNWSILFDGSHNAKLAKPDVWGVWIDDNGEIYLNTQANFNVPGASGGGADLFICTPTSLGANNTNCTYRFFWDGDGVGLTNVDGIDLELP